MKYYLVYIIIILISLLFLYTVFAEILRDMRADGGDPRMIMGADGGDPRMENFSNNTISGESLCSLYASKPTELNSKCNSLTETNCNTTSCCVWLNGEKCVAGNSQGPTFLTTNGKNIDIKNYSFMGKMFNV